MPSVPNSCEKRNGEVVDFIRTEPFFAPFDNPIFWEFPIETGLPTGKLGLHGNVVSGTLRVADT